MKRTMTFIALSSNEHSISTGRYNSGQVRLPAENRMQSHYRLSVTVGRQGIFKFCTLYMALGQGNDPMYLFIFTGPVRPNPPSPMYKLRSQSPDLVDGLLDTAEESVVSGLPLVVAVPKERITLTAEGVGNPRVPVSDALHTELALDRSASVMGGLDLPKWSCRRSAEPSCTSEPRGSKHPQAAGASGRSTGCACGYQSRCRRHRHRGQR